MDKHTNLFCAVVNYGHKKFNSIGPQATFYKEFRGIISSVFVIKTVQFGMCQFLIQNRTLNSTKLGC